MPTRGSRPKPPSWDEIQQHVDHVAHELRAPLAVLQETADLLRDGLVGSITPEQDRCVETIQRRASGLLRLLDDMLDVSRMRAGSLTPVPTSCRVEDLLAQAEQVLTSHAAAKGQQLRFESVDDVPPVHCDGGQIVRVVINLGMNAVKFTAAGGTITIRADHDARSNQVRLSVRDNGSGMTPQQSRSIFQRFHQGRHDRTPAAKGFGLGLHIAHQLVSRNGGRIALETEPGRGSEFSFRLPAADDGGESRVDRVSRPKRSTRTRAAGADEHHARTKHRRTS